MNHLIPLKLSEGVLKIIGSALAECQYKLVQPIIDDIAAQIDAHKKAQEADKGE